MGDRLTTRARYEHIFRAKSGCDLAVGLAATLVVPLVWFISISTNCGELRGNDGENKRTNRRMRCECAVLSGLERLVARSADEVFGMVVATECLESATQI